MNVTRFRNNRLPGVVFGWIGFLSILLVISAVFVALWTIGQNHLVFLVALGVLGLVIASYASYPLWKSS